MSIKIKLVGNSSGVTLTKYTKQECTELIEQLIDNEGINRLEITWDNDDTTQPVVFELTKDGELENETKGQEDPPKAPKISKIFDEPELSDLDTTIIFKEQDRISKTKLTPYIDIDVFSMGYHDQGEGKIVICYGTSKVYTSWEDMFKLPEFVDDKSIKDLNNLKQVAVRNFRKWMSNHPELLPGEYDPDREFRPLLSQDTKTGDGGDYQNTSADYGDE